MTRPVGARSFSTNDYRVRPQKMADMVAGRIRQMIARGELTDGEWLATEPELMEQFGVSRPTLREAFRLLESDSLVTIRRGPPGGARVTVPGPEAAAASRNTRNLATQPLPVSTCRVRPEPTRSWSEAQATQAPGSVARAARRLSASLAQIR